MIEFMEQALDSAAATAPVWLQDWQVDGRGRWERSVIPTRKTENWKYTGLQSLRQAFAAPAIAELGLSGAGVDVPELGDGYRLVFVNGHHRPELSAGELPAGVSLVRFADASPAQAERISSHLGTAAGRDAPLFTALNDAALAEGVFLEVAEDARVEQPLQLVWLTSNQAEAFTVNQRLLVLCGARSQATVIEHFASTHSEQRTFTNGVTELLLESGASLEHYRLHLEQGAALHIGSVHARLAEHATINSFHLALGSELKRIDLVVDHAGPGAHCEVNGVYLPRGNEHIDYHTCIEHRVPHCTSNEVFRGIIADEATAVFNGRIHIHPDAQKTRAQLSNKNLLTSNQAQINTKPELEIYADDVQCAHGATVAQLDELALHYLRTRGVALADARTMLSFGFINEVIDTVRNQPLREFLQKLLAERFARDGLAARRGKGEARP
jgi:Fe-S cluster assembly protein SufD